MTPVIILKEYILNLNLLNINLETNGYVTDPMEIVEETKRFGIKQLDYSNFIPNTFYKQFHCMHFRGSSYELCINIELFIMDWGFMFSLDCYKTSTTGKLWKVLIRSTVDDGRLIFWPVFISHTISTRQTEVVDDFEPFFTSELFILKRENSHQIWLKVREWFKIQISVIEE